MRSVKLLLDENVSPTVATTLRDDGLDAIHVRDRGLLAGTDAAVMDRAFTEDRIVVTSNVNDFVKMVRAVDVHGGLVLVEDGSLLREEQEKIVRRAVGLIAAEYDAGRDMLNRILRIDLAGMARFEVLP